MSEPGRSDRAGSPETRRSRCGRPSGTAGLRPGVVESRGSVCQPIVTPQSNGGEAPEFGPNPQGGTKTGFAATVEVNRNDFGVRYNGPIPSSGSSPVAGATGGQNPLLGEQTVIHRWAQRGQGGGQS